MKLILAIILSGLIGLGLVFSSPTQEVQAGSGYGYGYMINEEW